MVRDDLSFNVFHNTKLLLLSEVIFKFSLMLWVDFNLVHAGLKNKNLQRKLKIEKSSR